MSSEASDEIVLVVVIAEDGLPVGTPVHHMIEDTSPITNLFEVLLVEAMIRGNAAVRELGLLPGYSTAYFGQGIFLGEAAQNFLLALVLSLCFIYMVLAAQFESFVHPITIMLSLPLCLPFGLLTLAATGQTLNLNSIIGIFMLMGVVKKNSILQVDYANTIRERGLERFQAIVEANHAWLRPILLATPVFYSLFDDLGTPRWVRALFRAPAAVWDRFGWGWSRLANGRRSGGI